MGRPQCAKCICPSVESASCWRCPSRPGSCTSSGLRDRSRGLEGQDRIVHPEPAGLQPGLAGGHLPHLSAHLDSVRVAGDAKSIHRGGGRHGIAGAARGRRDRGVRKAAAARHRGALGGGVPAAVRDLRSTCSAATRSISRSAAACSMSARRRHRAPMRRAPPAPACEGFGAAALRAAAFINEAIVTRSRLKGPQSA